MFENMSKFQLRAACRSAGIKNASKMTNDQMREVLAAQGVAVVRALSHAGEHAIDTADVPAGTGFVYDPPLPATVTARWQDPNRPVVNNTPPRNRATRGAWGSKYRTNGRRLRAMDRKHLQPKSVSV